MGRFGGLNPRSLLRRLSPRTRMIVEVTAGFLLILLGAIAGFVPILQGWVFALMGLALLSRHSKRARRIYEPLKERFRKMGRDVRDRMGRRRQEKRERQARPPEEPEA